MHIYMKNVSSVSGGGIYNNNQLNATNIYIDNNRANGNGGGIFNNNLLAADSVFIEYNRATINGGGFYNYQSGNTEINTSFFNHNEANDNGGAIYNITGTLVVTGLSFIFNNTAGIDGGGIYCGRDGTVDVYESTLTTNNATTGNGGGIYSANNLLNLRGCSITENTAGNGGGIYTDGSCDAAVSHSIIYNNTSINNGGAVAGTDTSNTIYGNCIIYDNHAVNGNGGSFYLSDSSTQTIGNCTIVANTANNGDGGGVFLSGAPDITVNNSILWNNSDIGGVDESAQIFIAAGISDLSNSCILGLATLTGTACIDADPMFVGGSNYRLQENSPAVDAGDNGLIPIDPASGAPTVIDMDHNQRVTDGNGDAIPTVDMGAYESASANIPKVSFTSPSQYALETAGTVEVILQLTKIHVIDAVIPFTTTGNATFGEDYTITSSPVIIPAGFTQTSIMVTISNDTENESYETLEIHMGTPTGVNRGAIVVNTLTIVDDDASSSPPQQGDPNDPSMPEPIPVGPQKPVIVGNNPLAPNRLFTATSGIAFNVTPRLLEVEYPDGTAPLTFTVTVLGGQNYMMTRITTDTDASRAIAFGDLDGDGHLDVVVGNTDDKTKYYRNNGTAGPFDSSAGANVGNNTYDTFDVGVADMNGDGHLDIITGNYLETNRLYLNNATPLPFHGVQSIEITSDTHKTWAIKLADMDGDGDIDIVEGNSYQINMLYLNNGTNKPFAGVEGLFISNYANDTRDVAVGDIDGDGDLDLVTGNYDNLNRIYFNNGTANPFEGELGWTIPDDLHKTTVVALADMDGDGDLDLIVGNYGQKNLLYLNNGTANPFLGVTGAGITSRAYNTTSVAVFDADGDGDLDLVTGNAYESNRLYINNGADNPFESAKVYAVASDEFATYDLAAGDADGDGDPDLIAANGSRENRYYPNNGTDNPFKNIKADSIIPYNDYTGMLSVQVIVNDGEMESIVYSLMIEVRGEEEPLPNYPPTIMGLSGGRAVINIPMNTSLALSLSDLEVDDPDNTYPDDFTLSVEDGDNYTREGNTISPSENYTGLLEIPVLVNDGTENSELFNVSVYIIPDNDNDGMDDSWEEANGLDTQIDDSQQDLDGDLYTNIEEHDYQTDPNDAESFPLIPRANAGADQSTTEGETVYLNGAGSTSPNGNILVYQWIQTSGPDVTLSNSSDAAPTFVTPPVDESGAVLSFRLTVTDSDNNSHSDDLTISVADNGITGFASDVLTFRSVTGKAVGIKVVSGGDLVRLGVANPETIESTNEIPDNMVYGLIDMLFKLIDSNGQVVATFYLSEPLTEDDKWYQYVNADWLEMTIQANDTKDQITLTIVDNNGEGYIGNLSGPGFFGSAEPPDEGGGGGGGCFIGATGW